MNLYEFKTYDRLDIIPNLDYFLKVKRVEVWSGFVDQEIVLHFTDGMENGALESMLEISDTLPN
jgi:hypothetical protein